MFSLKNETWEEVLNANTNSNDMIWHNIIYVYINISLPIKEKIIYENEKPWITAEIRKCIRLKQKLFSKRDPEWKVQVRRILKLIKTAKLQFRTKLSDKFVRSSMFSPIRGKFYCGYNVGSLQTTTKTQYSQKYIATINLISNITNLCTEVVLCYKPYP